jgi:hypothetical protein
LDEGLKALDIDKVDRVGGNVNGSSNSMSWRRMNNVFNSGNMVDSGNPTIEVSSKQGYQSKYVSDFGR